MFVHTFGAYFGLAASYFFQPQKAIKNEKGTCGGDYYSQLIAMIGTIFLFMFWPSFNGALAVGSFQQRVIVNTVLSISASCITACGMSRLLLGKLDMEVLLNATLAGGVAVGSACDLLVSPAGGLAIGAAAGIVSALGFLKLSPFLQMKIGLHDTCGVHNLHGIPGIMGGIFGCIVTSISEEKFNNHQALEFMFTAVAEDGRTMK